MTQNAGPFADQETATRALTALANPIGNERLLDDLLPWGPTFLTGFSRVDDGQDLKWNHPLIRETDTRVLRRLLQGEWTSAIGAFRAMLTGNRFAAGELPRRGLDTAITAYVRINRAGVRVSAEERALAVLTRWHHGLLNELGDFCQQRDRRDKKISEQRSLLSHGADKQMGFSLWMSTVTRYSALFVLARIAHSWMGVESIDKRTFVDALSRWPKLDRTFSTQEQAIDTAAKRANQALLLLDVVLSNEIGLDHRMARPDTLSLKPMLEILSHIDSTDIERMRANRTIREAIAKVLHWTMLHPYLDKAEIAALCNSIHGPADTQTDGTWDTWQVHPDQTKPEEGNPLAAGLSRYLDALWDLWFAERQMKSEKGHCSPPIRGAKPLQHDLSTWAIDTFQQSVREATSLRHAAVGWLYALERRNQAAEFNWLVQFEAAQGSMFRGIKAEHDKIQEEGLNAYIDKPSLHPEKQHIIPFSDARRIAGKGGTRATASPANAIGNLTWLSSRQNGWTMGFSDRWVRLNEEAERGNLAARGLLAFEIDDNGKPTKRRALDVYEGMADRLASGNKKAEGEACKVEDTEYRRFRKIREDWMISEMRTWLDKQLSPDAASWLGQ